MACVIGIAPGLGAALLHGRLHVGQHDVARQRGFAGTRHTGNSYQTVQRHGHRHVLQVVQAGTADCYPGGVRIEGYRAGIGL